MQDGAGRPRPRCAHTLSALQPTARGPRPPNCANILPHFATTESTSFTMRALLAVFLMAGLLAAPCTGEPRRPTQIWTQHPGASRQQRREGTRWDYASPALAGVQPPAQLQSCPPLAATQFCSPNRPRGHPGVDQHRFQQGGAASGSATPAAAAAAVPDSVAGVWSGCCCRMRATRPCCVVRPARRCNKCARFRRQRPPQCWTRLQTRSTAWQQPPGT